MGRREIGIYSLLAAFSVGGGALVAGMAMTTTALTAALIWGGATVLILSSLILARIFFGSASSPRIFLSPEITPQLLTEAAAGRTEVQIDAISRTYAGKWMRVTGSVYDITRITNDVWMLFIKSQNTGSIVCITLSKRWHRQLNAISKGNVVSALGKIVYVGAAVTLADGEILHVGGKPDQHEHIS